MHDSEPGLPLKVRRGRAGRRRRAWTGATFVVAALALAATASYAARDDTVLISRAAGTGPSANGSSLWPTVSSDGRHVIFESEASNLDPDDADATTDVFVRDLASGATTLVSRASGAQGAKGNDGSHNSTVSGDGRYVTFDSFPSNLDPADGDSTGDAFVRDRQTATTTLVSRATGVAGAKGNDQSAVPELSGDGQYVAFFSIASNLDPADGDATQDAFVRDLQQTTTTLVSRATGVAGAKGNGRTLFPRISDDGRHVTFYSESSNLDPSDGDVTQDVFVRDLQHATTTLVSRATGAAGAKGNGASQYPVVSGDGRYVTFFSSASNLDPADGDATEDVFVRDLQQGTTTLVSRATGAAGAKGNGASQFPAVSRDGRYVTFFSSASNLDPADDDATEDVFVRDLQQGTTTLVSRATGAAGAKGNGGSMYPRISGDGRYVTFPSSASNLDPADGDTDLDVFVRDVLGVPEPSPPPSDPPGLAAGPPPPALLTGPPAVGSDRDADTIPDASDNCPDAANAAQSDVDADSIGDVCDTSDASPGPSLAKTVVVKVTSGEVYVRLPGAKRSTALAGAQLLPTGTVVDARNGRVTLTSAASSRPGGRAQTADFYGGIFQIVQIRASRPVTDIKLLSTRFQKLCRATIGKTRPGKPKAKRKTVTAAGARASKRVVAQLWGNGRGRFRTIGRNSVATVRGTIWLTQERCDGTLTRVRKGRVSVLDRRTRRTVTLSAGRSYLARATRAAVKARDRG